MLGICLVAMEAITERPNRKGRQLTPTLGKRKLAATVIEHVGIKDSLELVSHDGKLLWIHPTLLWLIEGLGVGWILP